MMSREEAGSRGYEQFAAAVIYGLRHGFLGLTRTTGDRGAPRLNIPDSHRLAPSLSPRGPWPIACASAAPDFVE